MTPLVRSVTLTGYVQVAAHVGLDPFAMLRRHEIAPERLDRPEARLPARQVIELLERSARESGRNDFSLLMANCRTFPSLGPVSLLLEHLSSVREIIDAVSQYRRHLNDILVFGTDDCGGGEVLKTELLSRFASPQACLLTVAIALIALTGGSRRLWVPQAVHFTHAAPAEIAPFRRFFPAPVQFDSSFNGFTSSREAMSARFPWANETMAMHARSLLRLVRLQPEQAPRTESVRRAIVLLLPSGRATLANVAADLALSQRSLQRELEKEGRPFASLLNEMRRELAIWYLGGGQSISSIAELLGYSSSSSFTRRFSEEFSMSPRAWRDIHVAARRLPAGSISLRTPGEALHLPPKGNLVRRAA